MSTGPRWYRWRDDGLELRVRVRPGSSSDDIAGVDEDAVRIRLQAPPVEGRANDRLCEFVARLFGVPKSQVQIARGRRARIKRVRVERPRRFPVQLPITPASREI